MREGPKCERDRLWRNAVGRGPENCDGFVLVKEQIHGLDFKSWRQPPSPSNELDGRVD